MEGLGLKIVVEGKKLKAFGSPKAFFNSWLQTLDEISKTDSMS